MAMMLQYRFGAYQEVTRTALDTMARKDGYGRIQIAMLRLISFVNIVSLFLARIDGNIEIFDEDLVLMIGFNIYRT